MAEEKTKEKEKEKKPSEKPEEQKGQNITIVGTDFSKKGDQGKEGKSVTIEELDVKDFETIVKGSLEQISTRLEKDAKEEEEVYSLSIEEERSPVGKLVNGILIKAIRMGASDIHLECHEKQYLVRFRMDGVLHTVMKLPFEASSGIIARIKVMATLDIAERRMPQDGRIRVMVGNAPFDFRVSTMPAMWGEKVVMRLLGKGALQSDVTKIHLGERDLKMVQLALESPSGMVLVTGPTGSGKSTTLYTMVNQLNDPEVNIVTVEDPIEYNLAGINQLQVRPSIGLTFEMALRAFLRQDPDVILVGEIRDTETAIIAIKAALTGHLVLSTLHTNDAPSTVIRLVDMGVDPYLVAGAVRMVIAQRLIRRLCAKCKKAGSLGENDKVRLTEEEIDSLGSIYCAQGCSECNSIGYKGRVPVFEVMTVFSKELKRSVADMASQAEIENIAKKEGMRNLRSAAVDLVNQGITSLEEAFRIISAE